MGHSIRVVRVTDPVATGWVTEPGQPLRQIRDRAECDPHYKVFVFLTGSTAGQSIDCAPCDFPPSSIFWPLLLQVRSQGLVDCWTNKRQCSMQHSVLIVQVLNRSTADRQQFRLDTTSLAFISVTTARAGCDHSPCYGRKR